MDAIQLVRSQKTQDTLISNVTNEVAVARTSKGGTTHDNLKARLDAMEDSTTAVSNRVTSVEAEIEVARDGQANLKAKLDNIEGGITSAINGLSWKPTVATFADLAKNYANAVDGWCANVTADGCLYRYTKATGSSTGSWIKISANAIPKADGTIDGLMSKEHYTKVEAMPEANTIITTAGGKTITGALTINGGVTGDLRGNATTATTATKVTNALTINGTRYDGSSAQTVNVATVDHTHNGSQVSLTGYVKGNDSSALSNTDTVNVALAKLENQIANKASTITKSVSYINHVVQTNGKTLSQTLTGYTSGDIVEVYISGVLLRPTHHYKISFAGTTATLTCDSTTTGNTDGWYAGEHITFKIIKIDS